MKAVVSIIGKDKTGIIAKSSSLLFDNGINIEDISQTILQGCFSMIMVVNFEGSNCSIEEISKKLKNLGDEIGVSINIQSDEIFNSMHTI